MSKNLITADGNEAAASVAFRVSALMRNGPEYLQKLRTEVEAWMIANEWSSLEEMRGNMSFQKIPNPAVYEREIFRRMFAVGVGARG
ncbi:MAG TPA: hypothetical protein VFR51_04180 [Pyrinomonadaceae bacterium]|nr:hypothetical protein [Pyrinomonadaceae bacterium]